MGFTMSAACSSPSQTNTEVQKNQSQTFKYINICYSSIIEEAVVFKGKLHISRKLQRGLMQEVDLRHNVSHARARTDCKND